MIIACVSTYAEGGLLEGCVASAKAGCDQTLVAEGAVGKGEKWSSDAAKRSWILRWAKRTHAEQNSERRKEPLWVLWLDGDEVLLWPEYLRDWTARAEAVTGAGGFPLRLVELDGSVALCYGKIIRADVVRKYLHSSYQIELHNGMVVALPNVKICSAGGLPVKPEGGWVMTPEEMDAYCARYRPPVQGEPHLLHRSILRDPGRDARRLSEVEGEWFEEAIKDAGLGGVE